MNYGLREFLCTLAVGLWIGVAVMTAALIAIWVRYLAVWGL